MFDDRAYSFFRTLRTPAGIPTGIDVLLPYDDVDVMQAVQRFLRKYFHDERPRLGVFGINPGRFGAGLTGIAFTDPVALREECGIETSLGDRRELSSEFIYRVIRQCGGPERFYADVFLTSFCPLGFTRKGKNYNFYDDVNLNEAVRPFIHACLQRHMAFPLRRDVAIVLGTGKLRDVAEDINAEGGYFDKLVFVEHPRYVMQYKRSHVDAYVAKYVAALSST